jgi:hypothetical protein
MPKIFGRTVSPITIVGLGAAAAYLGFTALFPEEPPVRPAVKKKSTVNVSSRALAYKPEDYSLKFASYTEPPKNAFRPLVVRQDAMKASVNPGALPVGFSGGGDWVYSGRVVVNGVPQGLLEDRASGDSEFVLKGQRWKQSTVLDITADSISLSGPEGARVTLIAGASEPAPDENVTAPGAVAPVTVGPGLTGQIGNIGVQPLPEATQNDRPRRRARRNRDTQGMEE